MENPLKWVLKVTQRSKEHTDAFFVPIAVIVNCIFGGSTVLSALISISIIMIAIMANIGQISNARIPIILTIISLAAWYIALRIVEFYLNFMDSQE